MASVEKLRKTAERIRRTQVEFLYKDVKAAAEKAAEEGSYETIYETSYDDGITIEATKKLEKDGFIVSCEQKTSKIQLTVSWR